jgi:hypothetical protein
MDTTRKNKGAHTHTSSRSGVSIYVIGAVSSNNRLVESEPSTRYKISTQESNLENALKHSGSLLDAIFLCDIYRCLILHVNISSGFFPTNALLFFNFFLITLQSND